MLPCCYNTFFKDKNFYLHTTMNKSGIFRYYTQISIKITLQKHFIPNKPSSRWLPKTNTFKILKGTNRNL